MRVWIFVRAVGVLFPFVKKMLLLRKIRSALTEDFADKNGQRSST